MRGSRESEGLLITSSLVEPRPAPRGKHAETRREPLQSARGVRLSAADDRDTEAR